MTKTLLGTLPISDIWRRHIWLRPLLVLVVLASVGWVMRGRVVLGLRIQPEVEFTQILETARIGESGESYAFDRNGLMLSNSRFDDQLRGIGLLPEGEDSTLNVAIRDSGVDLTTGARPKASRSELPLTLAASEAAAGREGTNVDGYRDYRGVPVVGAWKWLNEEGFASGGDATSQPLSRRGDEHTELRRDGLYSCRQPS